MSSHEVVQTSCLNFLLAGEISRYPKRFGSLLKVSTHVGSSAVFPEPGASIHTVLMATLSSTALASTLAILGARLANSSRASHRETKRDCTISLINLS